MSGTPIPTTDLALDLTDALDGLGTAYRVAGRSPQTILIFDTHIRHVIEFAAKRGITTVEGLTTGQIEAFIDHEQERVDSITANR